MFPGSKNLSWARGHSSSFLQRVRPLAGPVFQGRCDSCGELRGGGRFFCPACEERLRLRRGGFCPLCGKLYVLEGESAYLCGECRKKPPPWSFNGFFAGYTGLLKELVLRFKFEPDIGLAAALGALLYRTFHARSLVSPDIIVPVPLQADRLKSRGFNQSLELARTMASRSKVCLEPRALEKLTPTAEQSKLPRRERMESLKGAFASSAGRVQGKKVLLVDDVCTTGATFSACTRALLKSKAQSVDVICLARA